MAQCRVLRNGVILWRMQISTKTKMSGENGLGNSHEIGGLSLILVPFYVYLPIY